VATDENDVAAVRPATLVDSCVLLDVIRLIAPVPFDDEAAE